MAEQYEQEPQGPIDPVLVPDSQKLPVTIVSGFLGAGKTTLVNYILQQQHGMRIAVIENEFGAIGIDEELVQHNVRTAEDIISLDNGCVCCTVRGDLISVSPVLVDQAPMSVCRHC